MAARKPRLPWLDQARGIAVIAMIIYHTAWNADYLGLAALNVPGSGAWRWSARLIAAAFLAISGASLWLAHGASKDWDKFLRRLMLVAGGAALVTAATYFAFPESYIFFGILHCLAAACLIGYALIALPAVVILSLAAAALALAMLPATGWFDDPLLSFIGLRTAPPRTNDYVPLIPWIGCFLGGLGLAKLSGIETWASLQRAPAAAPAWPGKAIDFLGRKSLPVYLAHQPLLFGAMSLIAALAIPDMSGKAESEAFVRECAPACFARGTEETICRLRCLCIASGIGEAGLWKRLNTDTLNTAREPMAGILRKCG